jgi:hypothetical protein
MTRRTQLLLAAVLILAGTIAVTVWQLRPKATPEPADPTTMEPIDIARYVASDAFGRLSEDHRLAFIERARAAAERDGGAPMRRFFAGMAELSDTEQQQARKNMREVGRAFMEKRLRDYAEATEEEKTRMLDEIIDRMQDRRSGRRDRTTDNDPRPPRQDRSPDRSNRAAEEHRRRGPTPERIKRHLESSDAESRALRMQFMEDLRDRMEERGVEPRWGRRR